MAEREFEVIVFGSTGFTGRLVAQYIAATYKDLRWAMAGRSADKLAQIRDLISAPKDTPLIAADSADTASLDAMAKRTKVVLSTVGPYQQHGTALVAACAANGTDYVDLCGEPPWMHDIIAAYDAPAKDSGARIVLSCGFDSLPSDLGVYFLQQHAIQTSGHPIARIKGRVRKIKGGVSGGTAASLGLTLKRAAKEPQVLSWLKDPFSLVPGFDGPAQPHGAKPVYDDDLGSWSAPFIMATINTKNVHRSNALLGHIYGKDFVYDEMLLTGPGEEGEKIAHMVAQDKSMETNPPKPGEGPSEDERNNGCFDIIFTGVTKDGTRLTAAVKGDKDPGYGSTSQMIAEAAICLARDIDRSKTGGGVFTAAPAMGEALITRLTQNAGLSFEMEG